MSRVQIQIGNRSLGYMKVFVVVGTFHDDLVIWQPSSMMKNGRDLHTQFTTHELA